MESKQQRQSNNNNNNSASSGNISYTLYLYREELQRRNVRIMRLSRAKVTLTDKLISKNVRHIHECTVDDLRAINREMMFRKHLKWQIGRMRQLQQQQPGCQEHQRHEQHTTTAV